MQVEVIIEQAETLTGREIDVEGYIIVLEEAKRKIAFASTRHEINNPDHQKIFIDHNLAELRTLIRPLPTMQLMFRGVLTNPPYFYRFYAEFRATLESDDDLLMLKNISEINIKIPYVGKTSELTIHDAYMYSAQIDYTSVVIEEDKRTARAVVTSQKHLRLNEYDAQVENIASDENRYARTIANDIVRISGWLETQVSADDIMKHMIVRTSAVRASMVAVGPLREMGVIWLRPSPLYKLLKAHIPFSTERLLHQHIEVIATIDYLHDDDMPNLNMPLKLVFNDIYNVILHEEGYLW